MRRGGNYDQMQKTNMYDDQPTGGEVNAQDLAQSLEGLPAEALGILGQGGKKKKKKRVKRPRVEEQV